MILRYAFIAANDKIQEHVYNTIGLSAILCVVKKVPILLLEPHRRIDIPSGINTP
jgi:hypothetical protein